MTARKPDVRPRWTRGTRPRTLGVVMIVKNEAARLPALFESIAAVADEVVVVDTGSSDGTQLVCQRWGVRLVQDRWRDDFSRARNRAIEAATARYLLWLDADDRLPRATQAALCRLRDGVLAAKRDLGFIMPVENLDAGGAVNDSFLQTRIFPRGPKYRFRNAIHERITESLLAGGVEMRRLDFPIHHTGYADPATLAAKAERNEALLRAALAREPESVHYLSHLAQTLAGVGRVVDADHAMTDAIARAIDQAMPAQLLAEYHTLRATYRILAGNRLGAVYDLEHAEALWPQWGVPAAGLAELKLREEEWEGARDAVERGRTKSFEPGVHGFRLARARSNLEYFDAQLLRRAGRDDEAAERLRAAIEIDPGNYHARLELGELLLGRGEGAAAREVLEPAGEMREALPRLVDLSVSVALARAMTGELEGARACLVPLLDLFAADLAGADDVGAIELAEVLLRNGFATAAKHMLLLFQVAEEADAAA